MTNDYDLIVLGAGNAGQAAAGAAAKAGWRVAIVEARDVGGTCPNRGCVPKKVLVATTETLDRIARAGDQAIAGAAGTLDWPALIRRKRELIDGMPDGMEKSLTGRGIDVVHGAGRFVGPRAVEVDGRRMTARKIVIATGSEPRRLPFDGAELLATSDELLELDELPATAVFVGGGVIAFEFAHVLARAGSRVTILEVADQVLAPFDPDAVAEVMKETERIGVTVLTGVEVSSVTKVGDELELAFERGAESGSIRAAAAFNGAGRVPAIADLDLEAGGVDVDGHRIARDEQLRSRSNPDVYVAGDLLAGTPQLSPIATYEGTIVGHNLTSDAPRSPDYTVVPRALFTVPAHAAVGMTEAEAAGAGRDVEVKTSDMAGWLSGKTYAERVAFAKVLVDRVDDTIVGAHLVGHGAAETIHVFALAMRHGITASTLRDSLYVYPSFTNDIKFLV